ncbi:MAG TPA: L-histidine N(alpha)-methyltransferase [Vicinamibacterales bacterium]|nr:L-histidine N(alpha)-methyltransferase [Vicinamibacterales bacterium]
MSQHPSAVQSGRDAAAIERFAADVRYYLSLTPRQLPSEYFYDALGSALFDAICRLPWYGVTRAESRLIATHGADVFARLGDISTVVELGPGNGDKLRLLLEAEDARRRRLTVHLVDVSRSALDRAADTIGELDNVQLITHCATYDAGLRDASAQASGRTLVAFLGSNIGNFDPPGAAAFLHNIRTSLVSGDALLLGTDLVKPMEALVRAYDDPLGVTAAFNRNLLVRINRELDGNFDLDRFAHRAVWNAQQSRIEMHLVARAEQDVRIPRADIEFHIARDEAIWTESSYKYTPDTVTGLLHSCGFRTAAQWIDRQDAFALTLVEVA